MAQKHLKELLKEDQEPFHLKDYIAHKRWQLTKHSPKSKLQLNKQKPTSYLSKNTCSFSLQNSPEFTKLPKLLNFINSPLKSPNKVFLNVPAKTTALLREAAIRVEKQRSKTRVKNPRFGLFGSMLKRMNIRKSYHILKNGDMKTGENRGELNFVNAGEKKGVSESVASSFSSSCRRLHSLYLESSRSGRSFEHENNVGFEFANLVTTAVQYGHTEMGFKFANDNGDCFSEFCASPLSPVRFALHQSPANDFLSPAKSPVSCKFQDNSNYEYESIESFQKVEDEEDKEQNSPVSVLDPPFEDDYDGHEDESCDVECTYATVHRAHQELLQKLHRFEKLAKLDPIELEKRMIETEEDYQEQAKDIEEDYNCGSLLAFDEQTLDHGFMEEVISKSRFQDVKKPGIKRLISDLIIEEDNIKNKLDELVIKRVCNRLKSWQEVESNTIEMVVEMDLMTNVSYWKNPRQEIDEVAINIEVAIFAILVEELVEDLA